ncbi:MAG: outer membrane lipid asymmetry maintenance protein MlaD [Granulosicoccus sp.]|nr:outer membrane lipid asymmetry maintenance protein MlaD [Granulosicoccus sp.]
MNSRTIEIMVGIFMMLFFVAMFMLAMRVSNLGSFGSSAGYDVEAYFENVGGLRVRAPVSAGGVKVGKVSAIAYDTETYQAKVTLTLDADYASFPLDTSASIYTAGLLGEQYIGLEPGAEDDFLRAGDEIELTQSAVVLERLISQVMFDRSGGDAE